MLPSIVHPQSQPSFLLPCLPSSLPPFSLPPCLPSSPSFPLSPMPCGIIYNMLPPYPESRSEKSSKSRLEFELPRIPRGEHSHTDTLTPAPANALRFHWVTQNRDYSATSLQDIEAEYALLRRELLALNEQAARTVEKMALRAKPMRQEPSHLIEVRGREAENNAAIIGRLRAELQKLQKRVTTVGETGKEVLDQNIEATREQITQLRHKNKELQQKSKEIGSSIEAGDEAFSELKKLEVELSLAERKKAKLQTRWRETASNLEKVGRGLSELTGEAEQADSYIEEQLQSSRVDRAERKLESEYRIHSYNLEALRKNEESVSALKQQKYHQRLRQLEEMAARITQVDREVLLASERQARQHEELAELERGFRERGREEKENEKSPAFKATAQATRSPHTPAKQQAQSHYGRISAEEPSKTRLLNLRINRSVNRKPERPNRTIDAPQTIPAENPRILKKKTAEQKQEKTAGRVNSVVNSVVIPETPKKSSTDDLDQYFQEEHIEEEIQQSFLRPPQKEGKQEKQEKEEEAEVAVSADVPDQAESRASVQKEQAESEEDQESEEESEREKEEEDADLADFKRSIAAELTAPFSGVGQLNIALGEIESTIRKHESQARVRGRKEEPIAEEEEPLE